MSYKYKIEDYGNGLKCFVIYRNNEPCFHSNGFDNLKLLRREARGYISDCKYFDIIRKEDLKIKEET
jgi:hypothetical protein